MSMLWFRLRVAPTLTMIVSQIAIGVVATGLGAALFPAATPTPAPPVEKFTLRVEPVRPVVLAEAAALPPLVRQVERTSEMHAAPAAFETKAQPKPRKSVATVAVLPPARPRDPEPAAPVVVEATPSALAPAHEAFAITYAALDSSREWARQSRDLVNATLHGASVMVAETLHIAP